MSKYAWEREFKDGKTSTGKEAKKIYLDAMDFFLHKTDDWCPDEWIEAMFNGDDHKKWQAYMEEVGW